MKKVAIIGSPGSGKTTLSTGLFYHLKILQEHVEMIPELIKHKVYEEANFDESGFDVLNTLEQKKFESIFNSPVARKQIDFLICEAPLCNGFFYSSFYNKDLETPVLKKIAMDNINNYDLILFVERIPNADYVTFGRKEDLSEAKRLEEHIKTKIQELNYKNEVFFVNQKTNILELTKKIGVGEDKISKLNVSLILDLIQKINMTPEQIEAITASLNQAEKA